MYALFGEEQFLSFIHRPDNHEPATSNKIRTGIIIVIDVS